MALNAKTFFERVQPGDIIYHRQGFPLERKNIHTLPMTIVRKITDPYSFEVESDGISYVTLERVDLTRIPDRLKKTNNNKSRKNRRGTRKARKNRRRSSRRN